MRVAHAAVSCEMFRSVAGNAARLCLLDEILTDCEKENCALVVLPGGFLAISDESELSVMQSEIAGIASRRTVNVILGIDVEHSGQKTSAASDTLVANGHLPYFGVAVGPAMNGTGSPRHWRQTTSTSRNAALLDLARLPGKERLIRVADIPVFVLICGELFNPSLRASIPKHTPQLVVDLGHVSMGQGTVPSMKSIAAQSRSAREVS